MDNQLVMVGGYAKGWRLLNTIEVISKTKATTLDAKLPHGILGSCVIAWDETTLFVVGGVSDETYSDKRTYFVDLKSNSFTKGPELKNGRSDHACQELKVQDKLYIVVTGGHGKGAQTTEILDKSDIAKGWMEGKYFLITLGQKPTFYPETPLILVVQKCEFCEK